MEIKKWFQLDPNTKILPSLTLNKPSEIQAPDRLLLIQSIILYKIEFWGDLMKKLPRSILQSISFVQDIVLEDEPLSMGFVGQGLDLVQR